MRQKCDICGKMFEGYGNNPAPLEGKVCCDNCNKTYVIPARLKQLKMSGKLNDSDIDESNSNGADTPKDFNLREHIGFLIKDEVEAIEGYDKALIKADLTPEDTSVLEEIRNDELDHVSKLNSIYEKLAKGAIEEDNSLANDAGEHQEQMAKKQYESLIKELKEIEDEIDRNDNNPNYNMKQASERLEKLNNKIKELKKSFGYAIEDESNLEESFEGGYDPATVNEPISDECVKDDLLSGIVGAIGNITNGIGKLSTAATDSSVKCLNDGSKSTLNSLLSKWHGVSTKISNAIKSSNVPAEAKNIILKKLTYEDKKIPVSAGEYNDKVIDLYKVEDNLNKIADILFVTSGNLGYKFPEYKSELYSLSTTIDNLGEEYKSIAWEIRNILLSNSENKSRYDKLQYIKFKDEDNLKESAEAVATFNEGETQMSDAIQKGKKYRETVNSQQGYEDWEFTGNTMKGPDGKTLYAMKSDRGVQWFEEDEIMNMKVQDAKITANRMIQIITPIVEDFAKKKGVEDYWSIYKYGRNVLVGIEVDYNSLDKLCDILNAKLKGITKSYFEPASTGLIEAKISDSSIKDGWEGKKVNTDMGSGVVVETGIKNGKRYWKVKLDGLNSYTTTNEIEFNGFKYKDADAYRDASPEVTKVASIVRNVSSIFDMPRVLKQAGLKADYYDGVVFVKVNGKEIMIASKNRVDVGPNDLVQGNYAIGLNDDYQDVQESLKENEISNSVKDSDTVNDIGRTTVGSKYRWEERYGNQLLTVIEAGESVRLSLDNSNTYVRIPKEKFEQLVKDGKLNSVDTELIEGYGRIKTNKDKKFSIKVGDRTFVVKAKDKKSAVSKLKKSLKKNGGK